MHLYDLYLSLRELAFNPRDFISLCFFVANIEPTFSLFQGYTCIAVPDLVVIEYLDNHSLYRDVRVILVLRIYLVEICLLCDTSPALEAMRG